MATSKLKTHKSKIRNLALILALTLSAGSAFAEFPRGGRYDARQADRRAEPNNLSDLQQDAPPAMELLQNVEKVEPVLGRKNKKGDALSDVAADDGKDLALKIRRDAQKESALSYGARGGLAFRTKMIMDSLGENEGALDKAYDFRRLLIRTPGNLFIEPPIVSEAMNNFLVSPDGNEAAVSDTLYQITRQARIIATARNWRQYLERTWPEVAPPPDILIPETPTERALWKIWVEEGWEEGYKQADDIFQADLDRMAADFEGMVRYRTLLAQNKITAPFATMVDRGITGVDIQQMVGNKPMDITTQMRVGDRALRITQPVTLRADRQGAQWTPPEEVPAP
jgi:defect-in-organelle-trafficking protein DotC